MKWSGQIVSFLVAVAVAEAFVPPLRGLPTTTPTSTIALRVGGETIDAEVDYFYDDEDEIDPSQMKVSEIKGELDARKVDYSDCFEKTELEKRLLQARADPSKFQKTFGYEHEFHQGSPNNSGPIGMKSVETSFQGLTQNVHSTQRKKETFFGDDSGTVEVEV